jgi:NADPH-dependent 2,4-dienoyl-CoA reductase/sulfur reductase-like enzyme
MAPPPKLSELLDAAKAPENQKRALFGLAAAAMAVAGVTLAYKKLTAPPKSGRFSGVPLQEDEYLAAIVGAGPSGSSCGYYLARQGHKVALLDKARFPRGEFWWFWGGRAES